MIIFATTIVEPTGVLKIIETKIPTAAQNTEITAEQNITDLKFPNIRIDESAGNTTSADIRSEPTKFIAVTITAAMIMAIKRLYLPVLIPAAFAKVSSKVMAKILL